MAHSWDFYLKTDQDFYTEITIGTAEQGLEKKFMLKASHLIVMTRLRVDHTGLNSTLFLMGKRNNENCYNCGVKENAEHVILDCILYEVERRVLQNRVQEVGR